MNPQSPIAAALEQLQLERDNLAARLDKVDGLIASMREVFHLPSSRLGKPPADRSRSSRDAAHAGGPGRNGRVSVSDEAILAALRRGPLSPGTLASQLGIDRARLRYRLKGLERTGIVAYEGTTAARRVALAGAHPAKEAP